MGMTGHTRQTLAPPTSILDGLLRRAEAAPEGIFAHILQGSISTPLTVGSLLEKAGRWARLLVESGCNPGETVIVMLRHGPDLYPAFLGCVMAGCVPSFMPGLTSKQDPQIYWTNHDALFRRIEAAAVITWPENALLLQERIPLARYRVLTLGQEVDLPPLPPGQARTQHDEALALLQHSSGTTGLKKGVALSHGAILRQVASYREVLGYGEADVIASWLPLYHDMGLIACFMLPLVAGGTIVSLDAFEWVAKPGMLPAAIAAHRANWCWLPNFAFAHMVRARRPGERHDMSSIRAFINCSEPCKAETFEAFAGGFADCGVRPDQLQVCYAMAETVFAVTQTRIGIPAPQVRLSAGALMAGRAVAATPGEPASLSLSAGPPLPGMDLRICGTAGETLADGEVGQVAVRSSFLFSGYYRLPDATADVFQDGWYQTGDLGFLRDGELHITGRLKDVIIVHGKNIYAHDVEALLSGLSGVKPGRAVAIGAYNAQMASEDLAVICETEALDADAARLLRRTIRSTIEAQFGLTGVIVQLVQPGWLLKTTSGKISRKENLAKFLKERAERTTNV